MLASTLDHLRCPKPRCAGASDKTGLKLKPLRTVSVGSHGKQEVVSGSILCEGCRLEFPILGGVAILVEHVGDYLISHVKGIAREIPETDFPKAFRVEMSRARRELSGPEHIEDDLESQRVTALYVMTQYLGAKQMLNLKMSREMRELVIRYWDTGPFAAIRDWIEEGKDTPDQGLALVELGCGVGGLLPLLAATGRLGRYLGVDSSFASIALARRIALGVDHRSIGRATGQAGRQRGIQVPEDLLGGSVSRDVFAEVESSVSSRKGRAVDLAADFVVGDAIEHPLRVASSDVCVALNLIDMLEEPEMLPIVQKNLLRPGGWAIQGSPYIWHPATARSLARKFPGSGDSSGVVTRLYEAQGFSVRRKGADVPWLFFKNSRQLELYSVDLIFSRRG